MSSPLIVDLVKISTMYTRDIPVLDHFFDTLREDYAEFDQWYERTAAEGRQAWVVSSTKEIDALCIFKEECEGEKINDDGETLPNKFLKICTLKVADFGLKYGQRLLYSAFCYCIKNGLSSVYLQVRSGRHKRLCDLLDSYGFEIRGVYKNDLCFVKDMTPGSVLPSSRAPNLVFDYFRLHYPYHIDDSNVRKFIVSLSNGEHDLLFPDARNQLLAIPVPNRSIIGDANAIKKVFAKNSFFSHIRNGDMLFFCRKPKRGRRGATIECMGVVEKRRKYRNINDIPNKMLSKVPVDPETIAKMIDRSGYIMIVAFRLIPPSAYPFKMVDEVMDSMHGDICRLSDALYQKYFKNRLDFFGVSTATLKFSSKEKFNASAICAKFKEHLFPFFKKGFAKIFLAKKTPVKY